MWTCNAEIRTGRQYSADPKSFLSTTSTLLPDMESMRRPRECTRCGERERLAGMGLQAVHDMPVALQPLPENPIPGAPNVDVAIIASRHDKLIVLPQKGHPLHCLVVAVT